MIMLSVLCIVVLQDRSICLHAFPGVEPHRMALKDGSGQKAEDTIIARPSSMYECDESVFQSSVFVDLPVSLLTPLQHVQLPLQSPMHPPALCPTPFLS